MPLTQKAIQIAIRIGPDVVAKRFRVSPITVRRWVEQQNEPPVCATAAIYTLGDNRRPLEIDRFIAETNPEMFGVSEAKWREMAPILRYAARHILKEEKKITQIDANALYRVSVCRLEKWSDNLFRCKANDKIMKRTTFDRLETKGLVTFSTKFRRVALTPKGRKTLTNWPHPVYLIGK